MTIRPDMICKTCGSVLSAVTFECVRGKYCKPQQPKPLAPTVVDISSINEYGLEQKLSNSIRCF